MNRFIDSRKCQMPLVNIISAVLEALPLVFMHQNKYQKQHFILKTTGNTPKIFPAFGRILSLIRGEFSRGIPLIA